MAKGEWFYLRPKVKLGFSMYTLNITPVNKASLDIFLNVAKEEINTVITVRFTHDEQRAKRVHSISDFAHGSIPISTSKNCSRKLNCKR